MVRACLLALAVGAVLPGRLAADTPVLPVDVMLPVFVSSAEQRLGVMIKAPASDRCAAQRYRVEVAGSARVSGPIPAGTLGLVQLDGPLPKGPATLRVSAMGCADPPAFARRVMLGAASPDHSWRAGLALADVEGDALGQRQGAPVVQRVGRPAHIGLPGI